MNVDIYDRLRQFEILSHFSNQQIQQLAGCASRVDLQKGAKVVEEGEQSRDMMIIDVGQVEIQSNTPYGTYALASLGPGTLLGETSFVDGGPRSGDIALATDAALLTVHHPALVQEMESDQRFSLAVHWVLWKSLSQKLRETNETLAHFFSEAKAPPPSQEGPPGGVEDFHIGVGAKRELFQEQRLSPMEINFLSSLSKEKKIGPHEYIFREGDEGDQMYIVLKGRVMISRVVVDSGEEALAFLNRGDYFGEMALIDHKPRSADAKAFETGAVVLSISREVMEGLLDPNKVSSLRLLTILCHLVSKRLREIDAKLVSWFIFNTSSGDSLESPI
jgi:CRP-like cAMP-binding protein